MNNINDLLLQQAADRKQVLIPRLCGKILKVINENPFIDPALKLSRQKQQEYK